MRDHVPFRWNVVTPDQLGSMLAVEPVNLWFAADLAACAGKVLARSGNGDLVFIGRSLDSMFDLLGGALAHTDYRDRTARVPLSFRRDWRRAGQSPLTPAQLRRARDMLSAGGVTPGGLASRPRPLTFVDVVYKGNTYRDLYRVLRGWIDDEHAQWDVIRKKIRFLGVTIRKKTSPNTSRWHQEEAWTKELPRSAIANVSLAPPVWAYLGNDQVKLHRSYAPHRWLADASGPDRAIQTRTALAEAVAIVAYGRSKEGRRTISRAIRGEPNLKHRWLRALVTRMNASP